MLAAVVIAGIGLGGEVVAALTIVSEIMPTRVRGAALGFINVAGGGAEIFAASGLAALILGPVSGPLGGDTMAWRYLLGMLVVPALFIYYFRRHIPESSRYLIEMGRVDQVNIDRSPAATVNMTREPPIWLDRCGWQAAIANPFAARERSLWAALTWAVLNVWLSYG